MASGASTRHPPDSQRGRARTVKSCGPDARGLCVKSCGDAARPTGRAHQPSAGDGGNSATLPEESTKDTVKTIRAGKAGRPAHLWSTPCAFLSRTDLGCQPAPGFPCALAFFEGGRDAKPGRHAPREGDGVSARKLADVDDAPCSVSARSSRQKLRSNFAPMRRSNPESLLGNILDCFAEPDIGPPFARTWWLAMTRRSPREPPAVPSLRRASWCGRTTASSSARSLPRSPPW